jgi:DNA adenine methylase
MMMTMTATTDPVPPPRPWRSAFNYYGGKYRLVEWITGHFPPHDLYVEPYGGAASVLLGKAPVPHEIYNDLNSDVVNLFRVMRDPPRLAELVRLLEFTPYSREEFRSAFGARPADPVEAARLFLIRAEMSIGKNPTFKAYSGFDVRSSTTKGFMSGPRRWANVAGNLGFVARRLASVVIENSPALDIIERYDRPGALFYCDPPYVQSTKAKADGYRGYEMTDGDHAALAAALKPIKGAAVVSGYRCDLYDGLYAGWRRLDHGSVAQTGKRRVESLWLSPGIKTPARLF